MFIDDQIFKQGDKTYRRVLMRNSFRVGGKVRHQTVANLSQCSDAEIESIKLALKHRNNLKVLADITGNTKTRQGQSVGAVFLLDQLAKRLGISKALGNSRQAKLVLWMIFATIIEQGSRLSGTRLAQLHAVCDILKLEPFNEDHLYVAMDWLAQHQEQIEKSLFKQRYKKGKPPLYLYDVTSSYLEGTENELGAFGYNRDGKKGKMQIVVGLLTDETGRPVSVEVFPGNTSDLSTFSSQVAKVRERFGGGEVVFVGDRGMIRGPQIAELPEDCHYVTAISKAEIGRLLKEGVIQMELFDETVGEICDGPIRYILRRNPFRAQEMAKTRESKKARVEALIAKKNEYLQQHPRARVQVAQKQVQSLVKKLKLDKWMDIGLQERSLRFEIVQHRLAEAAKLDGCYVIKTDLTHDQASAQTVHDRYQDLAEVEWAFRTMKSVLLEMRAIFVRKAERTRAHVMIIMLGYMIAYELRRLWRNVEMTVEEGLKDLASVCATEVLMGDVAIQTIPEPRESCKQLLKKAEVTLPEAIPSRGGQVVTRKKLVPERRSA